MNVLAVKIVIYLRTYGGLHYALLFFLSWSMRLTESAGPGISNRCCSFATILSASAGSEEEGGRGEKGGRREKGEGGRGEYIGGATE